MADPQPLGHTGTLQVADTHFTQCSCGLLQVLQVQTPKGGGAAGCTFREILTGRARVRRGIRREGAERWFREMGR
jgi:hypothetical protein